ncbi:MAG: MotA/TolQ/ExbB proton channel family protein [Clostridia bacterium]|nr:MotA/TolQ/ExbB proton channel family protein [Clostridia bacterium]
MKQITSIPLPDLLVYVAIAVVTLIGILKCILPVADTTRGLNRAVQKLQGSTDRNVWHDDLFVGKRLKVTWQKFLQTEDEMEKRGLSCPVEDYINTRTVTKIPGNASLSELIPSLLTSLGILGTFIGLTRGLTGLDMTDANTLMNGIPILLDGMKAAFVTSLAGISCSLVFSMTNRIIQGNSYRAIDQFILIFSENTEHKALDMDYQIVLQGNDRNQMLSSVTTGLSKTISGVVHDVVSEAVTPVTEAMEQYMRAATEQQTESLQATVASFVKRMGDTFGNEFATLGKTITEINREMSISEKTLRQSTVAAEQIQEQTLRLKATTDEMVQSYDIFLKSVQIRSAEDEKFASASLMALDALKQSADEQGVLLQKMDTAQQELNSAIHAYQQVSTRWAEQAANAQQTAATDLAGAGETIRMAGEKLAVSYEKFVSSTSSSLNSTLRTFSDSMMTLTALINQKTAESEIREASTVDQLGEIQRLLARLVQSVQPKGDSEA